jgi:hypothetical protein
MVLVTKRTKADDAIERRLLELAYTTDAKITVASLAYFAPCTLDDAERVLDDLAKHDRVSMEVEDDGTIVYELRGRQRLPAPAPAPTALLAPAVQAPVIRERPASPLLAAAISLLVPGAGHLYAGRAVAAILWFLVVSAGYALILPGLVLHLFNIASAANAARRLDATPPPRRLGSLAFR